MNTTYKTICTAVISLLLISSCEKKKTEPKKEPIKETPTNTYTVPLTYNFSNVSYKGQTERLDMLTEMKSYMSSGNTKGTVLDAQKLKDMYANVNSVFSDGALNNSGKRIKDKVFAPDQNIFEVYMQHIAAASQSTVNGAEGVAGVVVSSNEPNKKYLCDAQGVEWTQVIEKGLMGALIYYQSVAVYLSADKIGSGVDNSNVVDGQGTSMEHAWDEAFGYFGVPKDFPTNTNGVRFWARYCNDRNALLDCNKTIMNAFIKGRAAISNKDYVTRDAQVVIIRDAWERVIAATIISYVNSTKSKITDDAIRNHNLSEVKGFLMNFKYNPTKKMSNAEITELETLLGTNYYAVSISNLDQIKEKLSSTYNLETVKNNL
jgi:hypothetical protein